MINTAIKILSPRSNRMVESTPKSSTLRNGAGPMSARSNESLSSRTYRYGNIYDGNYLAEHSIAMDRNLNELLKNPIKCGYLLAFCESEYSSENLRYLIEGKSPGHPELSQALHEFIS